MGFPRGIVPELGEGLDSSSLADLCADDLIPGGASYTDFERSSYVFAQVDGRIKFSEQQ